MKKSEFMLDYVGRIIDDQPIMDFSEVGNLTTMLVVNYQFMVASEKLLELAIEKTDGELREYFRKHLEEEKGHVEWLRDDLSQLNVDADAVQTNPLVAELVGAQYYYINHRDPATILGYLFALEAFPMPMELVETLEAIHGDGVMFTMRYHAQHDVQHRIELLEVIDRTDNFDMIDNAVRVRERLGDVFKESFGVRRFENSVKKWVAHRTKCEITDKSVAIGLTNDFGAIVAGVVYDHYTGQSISSTFAVINKTSLRKSFIRAMFEYPFNQLGVKKIINYVSEFNEPSIRLTEKFGFVYETTIKGVYDDGGDMFVYSMTRDQCKWLGGHNG